MPTGKSVNMAESVSGTDLAESGVVFSVFTGAAGALSAVGHHLRFDVGRYVVNYLRTEASVQKDKPKTSGGWFCFSAPQTDPTAHVSPAFTFEEVTCESSSLSVAARVHKITNEEQGHLSKGDRTAIDRRAHGRNQLESNKYPEIKFVPHANSVISSELHEREEAVAVEVTCGPSSSLPSEVKEKGQIISAAATAEESPFFMYFPKQFSGDLTLKGVTRTIDCFASKGFGNLCSNITVHGNHSPVGKDGQGATPHSPPEKKKEVGGADECVTIRCPIVQSDFGLTPFSLLGGALAVRDTVEVHVSIPAKIRL